MKRANNTEGGVYSCEWGSKGATQIKKHKSVKSALNAVGFYDRRDRCPDCLGAGWLIGGGYDCFRCEGTGLITKGK